MTFVSLFPPDKCEEWIRAFRRNSPHDIGCRSDLIGSWCTDLEYRRRVGLAMQTDKKTTLVTSRHGGISSVGRAHPTFRASADHSATEHLATDLSIDQMAGLLISTAYLATRGSANMTLNSTDYGARNLVGYGPNTPE